MRGKSRVVFFEVEPWEEEFLRERIQDAELVFHPHRLSQEVIEEAKAADFISCFIYSDLSHPILDELPSLQGIATMSVGTDHIDLTTAKQRDITVANVPAYGPNTVAEHTIALLLAMSRNIVPAVERTREGNFDFHGLTGWDLAGKTIGIVGTGKIGAQVARIAHGLGMKIIAHDKIENQQLVDALGLEYVTLDALFHRSDVITLHCPLVKENNHLLKREEFKKMKRGVTLINTARGGLIETRALIEALEDGIVKAAGIDVLEDEDLLREEKQFFSPYFQLKDYQTVLADHVLMHHPKVIVTPHNAFNSQEALRNILQTTADNIMGMIRQDPINEVV